jgi:hypothetical protein
MVALPTGRKMRPVRKSRSKFIGNAAALARACRVELLENRLYLTSAAYTWQNVNIPAGGFVDGIFYDPHNQNVMYARTDVGGLYKSTNDAATWTQLLNWVGGNTSGSGNGTQYQEFGVLSFAIDPQNSNNLYAMVGEYSGTNGDVLYSTNAGATWNTTPLSFYVGGNMDGRGAGERLAVDPYDSNIVFMGTNANGLWESTNAGHSFSQVASFSASASINLVLFDPNVGSAGNATQEIFVGENSTASGTNLFETTNGGTSWTEIGGTGSAPTGWMPERAAMASDGNLYLAYANDQAPNEPDNGGVFRYNTTSGAWANISPVVPQRSGAPYDYFGYCGLALDPNSPTTIVVTSLDRYNYGDNMWRTTNANAASPTWVTLYSTNGYNGFNGTRNSTDAPYTASSGDGIGNWATDVAIDPFNSAQIMHNTGGGIWATNNGASTTTLTAANSWYFPDVGIGMTALLGLTAANGGTPLFSAMGDVGGFAFTTLAFSPTQGNIFFNGGGGNGTSVDTAGLAPQDAVLVGNMGTTYGAYSTNGSTFTAFASNPGGTSGFSNGTVAISANGSTIVWAPSGQAAYYSTNNGASWTLSTLVGGAALPTGGTIFSDKVNPNYFYYWTENSNDNAWTLYISSDAGQTFAESAGGSLATGNPTFAVNPNVAGQLWLGTYVGIYESTNFGASFSHPYSYSTNVSSLAVGAPAPGSPDPAIYIYGTPAGASFEGIYRSDDGGNSWLLLNDVNHQFGGTGALAADPNVFGRVYLGAGGIIMGNPATSLPAGWSDADINLPGNPGWATSSTTLSTGAVSNSWNIVGGGAGLSAAPVSISSLTVSSGVGTAISNLANGFQIGQTVEISGASNSAYDGTFVVTGLYNTPAGLSADIGAATEFTFATTAPNGTASGSITATPLDQFNFAYKPLSGNGYVAAQLTNLTNADNGGGTPLAGVMFRAGANPADVFAELVQSASGNLEFIYRTTTGGSITTQTLSSVPVGAEYIEIVRTGNSFTALYSSNGTSWTQLGTSVLISAMPATANAGLAVTASYNPQISDATFANVVVSTGAPFATASGSSLQVNLGSAGAVSLSASGNTVTVSQGTQQFTFTGITSITISDSGTGDVLNFSGPVSQSISFSGATTSVVNVLTGSLLLPAQDLTLGALNVAANASVAMPAGQTILKVGALTVASAGKFDLGDNEVLINFGAGPDPIASVAAMIASGFSGGAWTGSGIFSTSAQANSSSYGIGYADGVDAGNPAGLYSGQIEILYTLLGDANLDGKVNGADFAILSTNFNAAVKGPSGWDQGDFNYDGKINGADFALVAANFNKGMSLPAAVPAAQSTTAVPVAAAPAPTTTAQAAVTTTSAAAGTVSTVLVPQAKKPHHRRR